MKKIEIRENGTKRVSTINQEPSKTDTQWKKSCDVNEIIKRYKKNGELKHLAKHQGQYADVSEIPDLLGALTQIQRAKDAFDSLPAHARKKFHNSPVEMIDFLQDSQNDDEAIRLGLKIKKDSPVQNGQGVDNGSSGVSSSPAQTQTQKT